MPQTSITPDARVPRVRFVRAVRVTLIDGAPKAYRVKSRNLSPLGMFLEMPMPVEAGTRVALALEAGDRVLPFAQGVVVWQREFSNPSLARQAGFGVKFTGFLHPRANEMVQYLCDSLGSGKLLVTAQHRNLWRKRALLGLVVASVAVGSFSVVNALVAPVAHAEPTVLAPQLAPTAQAVVTEAPEPIVAKTEPAVVPLSPPELEPSEVAAGPAATSRPAHSVTLPSGAATALTWEVANDEFRVSPALAAKAITTKVYLLSAPPRLVFDIEGAAPDASHSVASGERLFRRIRVGQQAHATRVVVDLAREPKSFVDEDGAAIVSF